MAFLRETPFYSFLTQPFFSPIICLLWRFVRARVTLLNRICEFPFLPMNLLACQNPGLI